MPGARLARLALGAAGLIAAALSTPAATLADFGLYHWGHPGVHFLGDSPTVGEAQGAACYYQGTGDLDLYRIVVRQPHVEAYDRTPGANNDVQKVAWAAVFQKTSNGVDWTVDLISPKQFATTDDNEAAPFTKISRTFTPQFGYSYRVVVRMFWYLPQGTVDGKAYHRVEYYRDIHSGGSGVGTFGCSYLLE